jgi:hypothetical protein
MTIKSKKNRTKKTTTNQAQIIKEYNHKKQENVQDLKSEKQTTNKKKDKQDLPNVFS